MKDLTVSNIERQNVLNNRYALQTIQENLAVDGLRYHDELLFTTKMVADFYGVDERTIKRYIQDHGDELRANGYFLSQGKELKDIKIQIGDDINVPTKTTIISFFTFRAFLNIGMLLTESERAKQLRTRILDIVIATINGRAGGGTKYINWRDRDYLPTAIKSENYRKNFTQAVGKYVDGLPTYKYEQITDLIYKAVFRENAKEYRVVLRLQNEAMSCQCPVFMSLESIGDWNWKLSIVKSSFFIFGTLSIRWLKSNGFSTCDTGSSIIPIVPPVYIINIRGLRAWSVIYLVLSGGCFMAVYL